MSICGNCVYPASTYLQHNFSIISILQIFPLILQTDKVSILWASRDMKIVSLVSDDVGVIVADKNNNSRYESLNRNYY